MEDGSFSNVFEATTSRWIGLVGSGIETFGVLVIVAGIAWATYVFANRRMAEQHYEAYKFRIGRSLLLGLEILVAADIVKTIAFDLTVMSLGLLAGLVLVRTFLSWTLTVEIEGSWPWRRLPANRNDGSIQGRDTKAPGRGKFASDLAE